MMKFPSLKLLADENISPRVVSFLREKGMDVMDAKEEKWHGKEDDYLLAKAVADNRFVLTHDSDFGTLAIKEGKAYYGILYLRLKMPNVLNIINIMERLLKLDTDFRQGSLVVVDDARVRIRLPENAREL